MSSSQQPGSLAAVDYTGVLRRRWWVVAGFAVAGLIGAAAYTVVAPKTYTATAAVAVKTTGADVGNGITGARTSGALVNLDTEAQFVTSGTVAGLAGRSMHSSLTPYQLAKQVKVTVPPNSQVLTIACDAPTAQGAATCANAFAAAYLQNRSASATLVLNAQIKTLAGKVSALEKEMAKLNAAIRGLGKNSATRLADQTVLAGEKIQARAFNGEITTVTGLAANVNGGKVITPATPPGKPSSPSKSLVLPSGLVAGLVIGLIVAFVWDRRDKRLHTAADVERLLGLPVLLNLPRKAFGRQVSLASPRSQTGRAFTELAYTVAASLGEGSHVVLVAGATPGPGASVVAANLAAALARTHSEAVLVCADTRDSVAPKLFGLAGSRGLAEVVAGVATVGEVVRGPAGLPGLWVIPPGLDTSLTDYQLQYDTARALTSQLRRDARFVVIEAPAGDDAADNLALAECADAAVLTIEVEHVTREEAAGCITRLQRIRVALLGAAALPVISDRHAVRPVQGPPRGAAQPRDNGRSHGEYTGTPAPAARAAPPPPARTRDGHSDPADRVTRH
jgi:capsular polysaccharide biosynthesis protein